MGDLMKNNQIVIDIVQQFIYLKNVLFNLLDKYFLNIYSRLEEQEQIRKIGFQIITFIFK
jgi:hypothetical protein